MVDDDSSRVRRLLNEALANSFAVPHGPHFQFLVEVIEEELSVGFAMERLGIPNPEPSAEGIRELASMIALEIDYAFELSPRHIERPPGFGQPETTS
jgi:hypothetical protein